MLVAAAVLFGFAAGTVCNFATQLKFYLHYDDCLDIFASHGIGGLVGNVSSPFRSTLTFLPLLMNNLVFLSSLHILWDDVTIDFDGILCSK